MTKVTMSSKKQPVDEARSRLQHKLNDVQIKTKQIQDAIEKISKEVNILFYFKFIYTNYIYQCLYNYIYQNTSVYVFMSPKMKKI